MSQDNPADTDKLDVNPDPAEFASVDDEEDVATGSPDGAQASVVEPMDFVTPDRPVGNYYFADAFRDIAGLGKR